MITAATVWTLVIIIAGYLLIGLLLGTIMAAFSGASEKSSAKETCLFAVTWVWFLIVNLWRILKR